MTCLGIDIETYSSVSLADAGVYAYAQAPDFTVLLMAYAWDDGPVQLVDYARGETAPKELLDGLQNPAVIKCAYNANFERTCLAQYLGLPMPPEAWQCTMVHAATLGLPGSLEAVGEALSLPKDQQKMKEGKALIRYFSVPCKPTKTNSGRTRNLPEHAPEKWELFRAYCKQDVETEREIRRRLAVHPMPEQEWRLWQLDQRINDRGVALDLTLVRQAIQSDGAHRQRLMEEAHRLTGLANPGSVAQLKGWLTEKIGRPVQSLDKPAVQALINEAPAADARRVLRIRQELGKTSVKKYEAMARCACPDGRARGLLQFYGANRTGRWAGRKIQVQNLPKNKLADLDLAREMVRCGEAECVDLLFDGLPDTLSQLIRTAFVPAEGCEFLVADFSAIEARVIAWLADERWRLEVFGSHGKIYEASAAQMFGVPVESITKGSPLRQKGKIAELALGYGGGVGALTKMGALEMGLQEEELPGLVRQWRAANPHITRFWRTVESAAMQAIEERRQVKLNHGLVLRRHGGMLYIGLPSGRELAYMRPRIEEEGITYEGVEQTTRKWQRLATWGGKLTENIVQAVARDCLAEAMLRLDQAGYRTVMHVHDEVVLEAPRGEHTPEEVAELMGRPIPWAPGLPLRADAYQCDYYRKD